MDEATILKFLAAYGPGYVTAILAASMLIKSGLIKELFQRKKEYVPREQCHEHIDTLTKSIEALKGIIDENKRDLKEYIEAVDGRVKLLLTVLLKKE